jgi:hypothetical protein
MTNKLNWATVTVWIKLQLKLKLEMWVLRFYFYLLRVGELAKVIATGPRRARTEM